ncbi:MAG: hypothetical protein QM770_11275 [Tepidisphaeraceae bacterium]
MSAYTFFLGLSEILGLLAAIGLAIIVLRRVPAAVGWVVNEGTGLLAKGVWNGGTWTVDLVIACFKHVEMLKTEKGRRIFFFWLLVGAVILVGTEIALRYPSTPLWPGALSLEVGTRTSSSLPPAIISLIVEGQASWHTGVPLPYWCLTAIVTAYVGYQLLRNPNQPWSIHIAARVLLVSLNTALGVVPLFLLFPQSLPDEFLQMEPTTLLSRWFFRNLLAEIALAPLFQLLALYMLGGPTPPPMKA